VIIEIARPNLRPVTLPVLDDSPTGVGPDLSASDRGNLQTGESLFTPPQSPQPPSISATTGNSKPLVELKISVLDPMDVNGHEPHKIGQPKSAMSVDSPTWGAAVSHRHRATSSGVSPMDVDPSDASPPHWPMDVDRPGSLN
jgi:hypothetical protein